MAYGLKVYDSSGNITVDTADLLPRFVGSFTVTAVFQQREYRFQLPSDCVQANTISFVTSSYGRSYWSYYYFNGYGVGPSWTYIDDATHELVLKDVDYFSNREITAHVYYKA